jgi:hypothetical protein
MKIKQTRFSNHSPLDQFRAIAFIRARVRPRARAPARNKERGVS